MWPMRPNAQMTSSETSSTSYSSQISRTRWKYPGGGGKQPPAFCTGSRNTAATVSGPCISIASAIASAGPIAPGPEGLGFAAGRGAFGGGAGGRGVRVGVRDVDGARDERLERLAERRNAGDRQRSEGRP